MKRETVDSLQALTALVEKEGAKVGRIIILFLASYDESGKSWCSDCRDAEPVVYSVLHEFAETDAGKDSLFVTAFVGQKPEWKTPTSPFRAAPFHVKAVPTLLLAGGEDRLEEAQLLHPDKIKDLITL